MKTRVVYNRLIPFKGFTAINLFGIVFVRKEYWPVSERTLRHEEVHTKQMKRLFYIGFYIQYLFEFVCLLLRYKNLNDAYRNISFEVEAYYMEDNPDFFKYNG